MTSNVHSGRARSRCSDISSLTAFHRSACETQSDITRRRTWSQMSKSVTSTQRGADPDVSTRWVARGWLGSRLATAVRSASTSSGPAPGSRTTSFRVWPVITADSTPRMCASSAESRSGSSSRGIDLSVWAADLAAAAFRLSGNGFDARVTGITVIGCSDVWIRRRDHSWPATTARCCMFAGFRTRGPLGSLRRSASRRGRTSATPPHVARPARSYRRGWSGSPARSSSVSR